MSRSKPYILCVDDDPMNLEILEAFLEEHYEVDCVTGGQECLDAVTQRKPDLILLDVMMPVIDGREVCRQLKSSSETSHILIIALSGQGYEEDINTMFELGVNSYLTKPFRSAQLLEVVADMVPDSKTP